MQGKVEIDAWLIPVQTCPFQPAAAALNCDPGQFFQQCPAAAPAAELFQNIKIFKVDSGSAEEGGKIVEEQGNPTSLPSSQAKITSAFFFSNSHSLSRS